MFSTRPEIVRKGILVKCDVLIAEVVGVWSCVGRTDQPLSRAISVNKDFDTHPWRLCED